MTPQRLDSSGNVGIGTTSPQYRLTIRESLSGTAAVKISSSSGAPLLLDADNTGSTFGMIQLFRSGVLKSYIGFDAIGNVSILNSGASPLISLADSGNVGIGTTSPQTKLEVTNTSSGATADQLYLTNLASATSTASRLTFRTSEILGSSTSTAAITGILTQNWTTGKGDLAFSTLRSGALTEAMRITDTGNVGIGTTTPGSLLSVNSTGNVYFGGGLTVSGATTLQRGAVKSIQGADVIQLFGGTTEVIDARSTGVFIGAGDPLNKLDVNGGVAIGTYAGVNTAPSNGLIVSGNVGIGTTTPGTKLEIVNNSSGSTIDQLYLTNFQGATSTASRLSFRAADISGVGTTTGALTSILTQNWTTGKGDLAFSTLRSGSLTEAMRIDSSGKVGINC
ncbi:MAG: hypothetical protein UV10_C0021G0006 [Candidatus Azambacteria bacterium GW2011_GWA1_42_19]|uniref:Uncharacterized protein n=1 Tax=Candidatus Azambacteria bacterium GW2011_GWA1_42_19 TaxID=1618609 RepID=A0A0G0ZA45_9BACT|nr:MAG: hypothetical protein UV10_C0021G0006 [Candidatus Azambacteria bacterium GW2011_GWA1_42_19]